MFRKDIEYYAHDGDKLFVERIAEYYRRLLDQSLHTHATSTSAETSTNTDASTQPSSSLEDLHTLEIVCFLKTNYSYQHSQDSSIYPPLSSSSSVGGSGDDVSVRGGRGLFDHASSWMSNQRKQEKISSILSYRRHLDYLTAKHIQLKRERESHNQGGMGSTCGVEMSFMDRLQLAATEGHHNHATITHTGIVSQTVPLPAYDTPLVHETRIEEPSDSIVPPPVDCSMREEDDVVLSYASLDSNDDDQEPPFHNLVEEEIASSNRRPSSSSLPPSPRINQEVPYTPSATHTHTHTPAGHTETGQSDDGAEDAYTDEVAVYSQSAYQVSGPYYFITIMLCINMYVICHILTYIYIYAVGS